MPADASNSKERFSSRVKAYAKYRPGYPPGVFALFREKMGLTPQTVLADIGSGTGLSAAPFLQNGNVVYCVEPNTDMRRAAEEHLGKYTGFRSMAGSGEETGLAEGSMDISICAQAFHWLDPAKAAAEFKRIVKPGGFIVIFWNDRKTDTSPFLQAYDELLLRYGTDYSKVAHEKSPTTRIDLTRLFGFPFERATFSNEQQFDLEGLRGRVESSSYTPLTGQPGYAELYAGLDELFDRSAQDGRVVFAYETEVYYGQA